MTDESEVKVTPRPGYPEHGIVSKLVCPEGHVVQAPNERSSIVITHNYPERSLVLCEECGEHYIVYKTWSVGEPHEKTLELAREEGHI